MTKNKPSAKPQIILTTPEATIQQTESGLTLDDLLGLLPKPPSPAPQATSTGNIKKEKPEPILSFFQQEEYNKIPALVSNPELKQKFDELRDYFRSEAYQENLAPQKIKDVLAGSSLKISLGQINDKNFQAYVNLINNFSSHVEFVLTTNQSPQNWQQKIVNGLINHDKILDLSGDYQIGDQEAEQLAGLLSNNQSFSAIYLQNNNIGSRGINKLIRSLVTNHHIEKLDLLNNGNVEGKVAQDLVKLLMSPECKISDILVNSVIPDYNYILQDAIRFREEIIKPIVKVKEQFQAFALGRQVRVGEQSAVRSSVDDTIGIIREFLIAPEKEKIRSVLNDFNTKDLFAFLEADMSKYLNKIFQKDLKKLTPSQSVKKPKAVAQSIVHNSRATILS